MIFATPVTLLCAYFIWCIFFLTHWGRDNMAAISHSDDTFKYIFLNDNVIISAIISLKFVPKGPINDIPALVQIMAWRRPGDKPLSEPMMGNLLTHICVTRPQWVNRRGPRSRRQNLIYYTHMNTNTYTRTYIYIYIYEFQWQRETGPKRMGKIAGDTKTHTETSRVTEREKR